SPGLATERKSWESGFSRGRRGRKAQVAEGRHAPYCPAAAAAHRGLGVARDLAAPAAALAAARLDQLLEALEVALDPAVGRAERVAHLLLDALGHEVHLHHDS